MARSLNKAMLLGNLGADPEIRSTSTSKRVATLSVATSVQWNNAAGERQEKTEWHRVVAWNNNKGGGMADFAERYLKKGDKIYVEGSIEYRTWEDREGKTRYSTEIVARELIALSPRGDGGGDERAGAAVSGGKAESFDDFPEALDGEDDDLPFLVDLCS